MVKRFSLIMAIATLCAQAAAAQDDGEQRMRKALQGRMVMVKLDLPAIDSGVPLILDNTNVSYSIADCDKLVKEYGIAIKKGSKSRITGLKISRRGIEIDLDGGGLPGVEWVVGSLKLEEPSPVPKSDREVELERQIQNDSNTGSYARNEIEYERQRRYAQDERNREAFSRISRMRAEYITANRKNWGSKIIVVVRSNTKSISMGEMVKSLAKYVELLPSDKPAT